MFTKLLTQAVIWMYNIRFVFPGSFLGIIGVSNIILPAITTYQQIKNISALTGKVPRIVPSILVVFSKSNTFASDKISRSAVYTFAAYG